MIAAFLLAALVSYAPAPANEPTGMDVAKAADVRALVNNFAPEGVTVAFKTCGFANAFYDRHETITVCFEMADTLRTTLGYVEGVKALRFVVMHEIGHAVFNKEAIPFTGNEEQAADEYAAINLIWSGESDAVEAVVDFFAIMGQGQVDDPTEDHPTMYRRAYPLLCYAKGAESPDVYQDCAARLYHAMGAWSQLLGR